MTEKRVIEDLGIEELYRVEDKNVLELASQVSSKIIDNFSNIRLTQIDIFKKLLDTKMYYAKIPKDLSQVNYNYKSSTIYSSYRYNDEVKKNVAPYYTFKSLNTCEIENSTLLFNSSKIKTDIYEDEIIHKRTQMFDLSSVDENYFYELREKTKYIRRNH